MANPPLLLSVTRTVDREAAFRRLIDDRLEASYRLATILLGDREEAEDATHDAIVRAWRAFGGLRHQDRFEVWFQRIVVNVCRDHLRGRRARPTAALVGDHADPRPGVDPGAGAFEGDALARALERLNPDQQVVVVMRFYLDLPLDEIARRLDAPLGTVKSRLHHALRALRAAYDASSRSPLEVRS